MVGQVLKLANSVAYSRGEPGDSIPMAVSRIGMERIRKAVSQLLGSQQQSRAA